MFLLVRCGHEVGRPNLTAPGPGGGLLGCSDGLNPRSRRRHIEQQQVLTAPTQDACLHGSTISHSFVDPVSGPVTAASFSACSMPSKALMMAVLNLVLNESCSRRMANRLLGIQQYFRCFNTRKGSEVQEAMAHLF